MNRKLLLLAGLVCACVLFAPAQRLRNPLDFPPLLSGNFGELRANHFHAGIDFKTQGEEGKSVHSVRTGYVSRIAVSPWGYGNAVYVTHPSDSLQTVYAHLQRFADRIADWVREKQYEAESFSVDLTPSPEQFPVREGDVIGYSGNSGSSGGAHLHFEVRDLETGHPFDPLPFYEGQVKDTRPPTVHEVMVHPVEGQGAVNGSSHRQRFTLPTDSGVTLEAWGKIGFSIRAVDRMDGTTNIYGVKEISMSIDGLEVFHSFADQIPFDQTRYLNAWIDYATWRDERTFFTKTFVEPGNRLHFIRSRERGYLTVSEPRLYRILFRLSDAFGNITSEEVRVQGCEQEIPFSDRRGTVPFFRQDDNPYGSKGIRLFIPARSLYTHLDFRHTVSHDTAFLSDVHRLHDRPTPLHHPAQLSLRIRQDTLGDTRCYGIVSLRNGRRSWLGGTCRDGWIDADIRELGLSYAVTTDTTPPKITPLRPQQWVRSKRIAFRLTDNLSGVHTYRGTIDGQYALFEFDGKKSQLTYDFDPQRLRRGRHTLVLTVADACGNTSVHEAGFTW
jgi:hypothetical protein